MMQFSLITRLLAIGLLVGTVGCYSTIPAERTGLGCWIVREISRDNSSSARTYGANPEKLIVDGQAVDVYFKSSGEYSYNSSGLIIHEQIKSGQNLQNTEFTYTSGKLTTNQVITNGSGTVTGVYSETIALNDMGYEARYSYDAEGILLQPKYAKSEKRVNGNLIQQIIDDDGRIVTLNYTYDLTHLSMLNPRQFQGRMSRNLLLTSSSSGFHCCISNHSEYRYQFDSQGRVNRRIRLYWPGEFPNGSPPGTVYVTDYEYSCN